MRNGAWATKFMATGAGGAADRLEPGAAIGPVESAAADLAGELLSGAVVLKKQEEKFGKKRDYHYFLVYLGEGYTPKGARPREAGQQALAGPGNSQRPGQQGS